MGLVEEKLDCDDEQITYTGVERRLGLWRWTKVTRAVKLRDVAGVHEQHTSHPFLWLLGALAAINVVANLTESAFWWHLELWKLPYLWVGASVASAVISTTQGWIATNIVLAIAWFGLALWLRREYLVVDAGMHSTTRMRTSSVSPASVLAFKQAFYARWSAAKQRP
jgi:hypothetical protein